MLHATAQVTAVPETPPSRVATVVAPPPPAPARCTATLRASFHLRPRAVVASIGPEIAARTEVEVLALSNVQRTGEFSRERSPVLAHVRVVSTRREGYAFVAPTELSAGCPLLSGVRPGEGPITERLGHAWRENYDRGNGSTPAPPRDLTWWANPFNPARDRLLERLDLDHNGTWETLFLHEEDTIHTIVLWRGTRGMPALVLTQEHDHDHSTVRYEGSVHAGRAVYFAVRRWSMGLCAWSCTHTNCDYLARVLYRLHPDGNFVEVASVPVVIAGEEIDLRGERDDDLRAAGRTTGRTQLLRWDAARFALVPEGEQLPVLESSQVFCRDEVE